MPLCGSVIVGVGLLRPEFTICYSPGSVLGHMPGLFFVFLPVISIHSLLPAIKILSNISVVMTSIGLTTLCRIAFQGFSWFGLVF